MAERQHEGTSLEPLNPYVKSTLVEKVRKNNFIVFCDLDASMDGDKEISTRVRNYLDTKGIALVAVTSRPPEVLMSKDEFSKSEQLGFHRPAPHLLSRDGVMVEAFADQMDDTSEADRFAGLYDFDAMASTTGTEVYIHQADGGYLVDLEYKKQMGESFPKWQENTLQVLALIDPEGTLFELSQSDTHYNFQAGKTDVSPPDYRFWVNFPLPGNKNSDIPIRTGSTSEGTDASEHEQTIGIEKKKEFEERLARLRSDSKDPVLQQALENIHVTDDSNPEKGRFAVYLTPKRGSKGRGVNWICEKVVEEAGGDRHELETLYIGDSWPDVSAGLLGSITAEKATFLIVGGSRLTPEILEAAHQAHAHDGQVQAQFAGEGLTTIGNRLIPTETEGIYTFVQPLTGHQVKVIFGDIVFEGTTSIQTVEAYLRQKEKQKS